MHTLKNAKHRVIRACTPVRSKRSKNVLFSYVLSNLFASTSSTNLSFRRNTIRDRFNLVIQEVTRGTGRIDCRSRACTDKERDIDKLGISQGELIIDRFVDKLWKNRYRWRGTASIIIRFAIHVVNHSDRCAMSAIGRIIERSKFQRDVTP